MRLPSLHALDWNQYRGLQSDNKTTETLASTDFLGKSKSLKWKAPTPLGFSSFAVVGSKAYTMVAEEDEDGLMREVCIALDLQTGKRAWSAWLTVMDYKSGGGNAGTSDNKGGDGPRSTPSVFGDKVWVYDSDMNLHCLSAKDGKSLWKVRVLKDHGGANIKWKNASAPLVVDDLVIVYGGGQGQSFLAFDRESGKLAWKSGSETATHATPITATIHGVRQVTFLCLRIVSVYPKSGAELWRQKLFKVSTAALQSRETSSTVPRLRRGLGCTGSSRREPMSSEEVWRKANDMFNHWSTPIYHEGHLYGMFGFKKYGQGPLQCIELESGEIKWSQDGYGPGNVILSGDKLIALSDIGELAVVAATPSKYTELSRSKVITGKCWSTPVFSNGLVLARSTGATACR